MGDSKTSLWFLRSWKDHAWTKTSFVSTHSYNAIVEEEKSSSALNLRHDQPKTYSGSTLSKSRLLKCSSLIIATTILIIELIFIVLGHSPTPYPTTNEVTKSIQQFANTSLQSGCGQSVETAVANGCKFDYLTIAWETPECYHADIVDSFYEVQDWKYYNDSIGTPIPPGVSITDGHQRWNVKWDFHFTHCVYTWKSMQAAVLERRPMPDNLLDLEHTRHCMGMLLDKTFVMEDMHTMVHVKWPKCASYEEWDEAKWIENLVLPEQEHIH